MTVERPDVGPVVKTCEYDHHYYAGSSCPLCDFFGRKNLERAYGREL